MNDSGLQKCFNLPSPVDFEEGFGYNRPVGIMGVGGSIMNENKTTTKLEDQASSEKREIANMDIDDFMNLLMESRIIQAS